MSLYVFWDVILIITFKRRYHYPRFEEEDIDIHGRQMVPSDSLCRKEVEKPN